MQDLIKLFLEINPIDQHFAQSCDKTLTTLDLLQKTQQIETLPQEVLKKIQSILNNNRIEIQNTSSSFVNTLVSCHNSIKRNGIRMQPHRRNIKANNKLINTRTKTIQRLEKATVVKKVSIRDKMNRLISILSTQESEQFINLANFLCNTASAEAFEQLTHRLYTVEFSFSDLPQCHIEVARVLQENYYFKCIDGGLTDFEQALMPLLEKEYKDQPHMNCFRPDLVKYSPWVEKSHWVEYQPQPHG